MGVCVASQFRSYTDPLNNNNGSVPPLPPPPPPLNIPPSRARLQLAARLAMHQKNAAAAASDDAERSGLKGGASSAVDDDDDDDEGPSDPFADDAEGVESDDEGAGGSWGEGGRGGWWRDVVVRKGLSDSEEEGDEEFGEFAIPEGEDAAGGQSKTGSGSGEGQAEGSPLKVVKPLAVHPVAGKSGFGSLWPFNTQHFGAREAKAGEGTSEQGNEGKATGEGKQEGEEGEGISRTVEAKKRTSLDDGDDEVVV